MSFLNTEKSTPRENQRRIFIDSLYRELDKAAAISDSRNSRLTKRANQLIFEDRLPEDFCVDMLIMEGFSDFQARQSVEMISLNKTADSVQPDRYDYCFEDHRGRMFTGRELNNVVEANSEDEARKSIKEVLASFNPPVNLLSITKIS